MKIRYETEASRGRARRSFSTAVLERDGQGGVHWNPPYLDFAEYYITSSSYS